MFFSVQALASWFSSKTLRNGTSKVLAFQKYVHRSLTSFFHTKLIGAGVRHSCLEMRVYLRLRRPKAEEAQGPPLDKGVPAVQ
ncbi:hypothetical protein [Peribacillus muralis]|uniref:hypothetical protein n=1 Tax=Peribacillus muralis TaxID=264697 RepID=UPI00366CB28D